MGNSRAILLTGPGAAAIAVVRLTGSLVAAFLDAHLSRTVVAGRATHVNLHAGSAVVDDPVVFVGEGFAEIHLHGGPWIVQSVLDLAKSFGFDVRAEYSLEAEDADGDTLIEREMAAWLPLARTELAIAALLAQGEAWKKLSVTAEEAGRMLRDESLYWLLNPPRVAIVGPANAGKSTLANRLYGQERSIVADLPGTTRDWVGEYADINGLVVMLVDTPGQRATADSIEGQAIEQSREQIGRADRVVFVMDGAAALADQIKLLEQFPGARVVINKVDRPAAWNEALGLPISALRGEGVDSAKSMILGEFGIGARGLNEPRWWTARQKALLEQVARDGDQKKRAIS